jgi:hypothetical protein
MGVRGAGRNNWRSSEKRRLHTPSISTRQFTTSGSSRRRRRARSISAIPKSAGSITSSTSLASMQRNSIIGRPSVGDQARRAAPPQRPERGGQSPPEPVMYQTGRTSAGAFNRPNSVLRRRPRAIDPQNRTTQPCAGRRLFAGPRREADRSGTH